MGTNHVRIDETKHVGMGGVETSMCPHASL